MQELTLQDINMVSGAGTERAMDVVYNTAAGAFAGGCAGFIFGGPFGAVAGAISGGGHAFLFAMMMR